MTQNVIMNDPVFYLSLVLGLGGIYVLITSFHDEYDDSDDDGERFIYKLEYLSLLE